MQFRIKSIDANAAVRRSRNMQSNVESAEQWDAMNDVNEEVEEDGEISNYPCW